MSSRTRSKKTAAELEFFSWKIVERDGKQFCTRCNMPVIPECGARAIIPVDSTKAKPCPNIYVQSLRNHLGPEIAGVKHDKDSPLITLTDSDVRIQTESWRALLPHLKAALGKRGLGFSFLILADERIRYVFVGNAAYRARRREEREASITYNDIHDLVAEPDLVIIRVGQLGYKNIAAGGALKEALFVRDVENGPTWCVEENGTAYLSSHSYDEEVDNIVSKWEQIEVGEFDENAEPEEDPYIDDGSDPFEAAEKQARSRLEPQSKVEPDVDVGDVDFDFGSKGKPWKKKGGKWK